MKAMINCIQCLAASIRNHERMVTNKNKQKIIVVWNVKLSIQSAGFHVHRIHLPRLISQPPSAKAPDLEAVNTKCNATSVRPLHNACHRNSIHAQQAPPWTHHGLPATIVARPPTPTGFPDARSTQSRARRCDTPSAHASTNCCTSTSYRVPQKECRRGHQNRRDMRRSRRARAKRAITMLRLSGRLCVSSLLLTRA